MMPILPPYPKPVPVPDYPRPGRESSPDLTLPMLVPSRYSRRERASAFFMYCLGALTARGSRTLPNRFCRRTRPSGSDTVPHRQRNAGNLGAPASRRAESRLNLDLVLSSASQVA